jgi:hypothetical protein
MLMKDKVVTTEVGEDMVESDHDELGGPLDDYVDGLMTLQEGLIYNADNDHQ